MPKTASKPTKKSAPAKSVKAKPAKSAKAEPAKAKSAKAKSAKAKPINAQAASSEVDLETFRGVHQRDAGKHPPASGAVIAKYRGVLPDFLLEIWEKDGFCSFSNGFLWLVSPDDLTASLQAVLPDCEGMIPVLRTAMGSVIFLMDGRYRSFEPIELHYVTHGDFSLEEVMNFSITEDESLDTYYYRTFYTRAFSRLGAPAHDECYGFVPAIALGGDRDVDNLQRVKLRGYLETLAQAG